MEMNLRLYSRDVMFYLGGDKLADHRANLTKETAFLPSTDPRSPPRFLCRFISRMKLPALKSRTGKEVCGPCKVAVTAGGDMAAALLGWAIESPVARYANVASTKCVHATRRNFLVDTCLANLNPFELCKHAPGIPSAPSLAPRPVQRAALLLPPRSSPPSGPRCKACQCNSSQLFNARTASPIMEKKSTKSYACCSITQSVPRRCWTKESTRVRVGCRRV
eukprot:6180056-Pleurochrysis_carterae.AAC.3